MLLYLVNNMYNCHSIHVHVKLGIRVKTLYFGLRDYYCILLLCIITVYHYCVSLLCIITVYHYCVIITVYYYYVLLCTVYYYCEICLRLLITI